MTVYVCRNPECSEVDVPKDAAQVYEIGVQCGVCGQDCEPVES